MHATSRKDAMAIGDTFERYCLMREDSSPYQVNENLLAYSSYMVCMPDDEVYKASIEECDERDATLYGWRYTRDGILDDTVKLIYPSLIQVGLAFGGSYEPAVSSGIGEIVYLRHTSTECLGKAKDI